MKTYTCDRCTRTFKQKIDMDRHNNKRYPCFNNKLLNADGTYSCPNCTGKFSCKNSLSRHYHNFCPNVPREAENEDLSKNNKQSADVPVTSKDVSQLPDDALSDKELLNDDLFTDTFEKSHQLINPNISNNNVQPSVLPNSELIPLPTVDIELLMAKVRNKPKGIEKGPQLPVTLSGTQKDPQQNDSMRCNYCHKIFAREYNLSRHISKSCKVRKADNQEKETILQMLIKEMEEQKRKVQQLERELKKSSASVIGSADATSQQLQLYGQRNEREMQAPGLGLGLEQGQVPINTNTTNIQNMTNNNQQININTTNNNIKLVAFGKEDLSYISKKKLKEIMAKGFQSVPTLIEYIHFDKNKPEQHNIYISNMKDTYAIAYDGFRWILMEKKEAVDKLYEEKASFLEIKLGDMYNQVEQKTKDKMERYLETQEEEQVEKPLKSQIKLMLYNKNHIPLKTRRKIEEAKEQRLLQSGEGTNKKIEH